MKIDLKGTMCEDVDWIHLVQCSVQWWFVVSSIMNIQVIYNAWNFVITCASVSFPGKFWLLGFSLYSICLSPGSLYF
jgi:hypothetical protein